MVYILTLSDFVSSYLNTKEVCTAVVLRTCNESHFIKQPGLYPSSFHRLKPFLHVGCWNVRSLVEADGRVKTVTL